MPKFFDIDPVRYEGPDSTNPLAFTHYNPDEMVDGKSMRDHLRFAACYWHCMTQDSSDPLGAGTRQLPWQQGGDAESIAMQTMDAMFEFLDVMDIDYWAFHDRDIAPEMPTLRESNAMLDKVVAYARQKQQDHKKTLLWGTACLFVHPRYMAGAGTSPSADVFAYAGAQVKKAIEVTHELGGLGYTFWGGREGYDTLLNTRLDTEMNHLTLTSIHTQPPHNDFHRHTTTSH